MAFVLAILFALSLATAATAQETQTKTFNIDGTDFAFKGQKTASGKDFGYFV